MITAALVFWALWVAFNVALLVASPYLIKHTAGPFTNGLKIVIPPTLADRVSPNEMQAMLSHERGHIAHRHNLKNLLLVCVFIPRGAAMYQRQELEADDYAADRGHALALASALRKLSFNDFDWYRAARLSQIAAQKSS